MKKINLLPWRQEAIQYANKKFYAMLCISLIAMGFVMIFSHLLAQWLIDNQIQENMVVQEANNALLPKVKATQVLKDEKKMMIERASVIADLQKDRVSLIRLIDTLAEITPDGFFISTVTRKDSSLKIEARSDSYTRISEMLRKIELCNWLSSPILTNSKTQEKITNSNENNMSEIGLILELVQGNPLEDSK